MESINFEAAQDDSLNYLKGGDSMVPQESGVVGLHKVSDFAKLS